MLGVAGELDVLSPSPANRAGPFPTGRKSKAGRRRFFPTRRKSRQNPLDNVSCLCASLEGGGIAAGRGADPERSPCYPTMCMKTKVLSQNSRDFRKIISYSRQSIYRPGRVQGQKKRGIKKCRVSPTMLLKTNKEKIKDFHNPTISMKAKILCVESHDVDEKTGA